MLSRSALPYQTVVIANFVLRLTWSAKLSPHLHRAAEVEWGVFVLELLEVLRRWLWVYFRVEFESLKIGVRAQPGLREIIDHAESHELPL